MRLRVHSGVESLNKPPAFQFYVDDYIGGTQHFSDAEKGLYVALLCEQWSNGSIPDDDDEIASFSRGGTPIHRIKRKFVKGPDGRLRNERMEKEREKQRLFRESRAENGKLGGRPLKASGKLVVIKKEATTKATESPPVSVSDLRSPNSDPELRLQIPTPSVKGAGKRSTLPDSDWISSLKGNPAYAGIDIDRELGRMQLWASEKRKVPSRARFLNWLNRAEKPLLVNGSSHSKPLSLFDLKTILQAKEVQAQALKARYSSEAAMGTNWSQPEKRKEWLTLRSDIKELTNKIASYAAN